MESKGHLVLDVTAVAQAHQVAVVSLSLARPHRPIALDLHGLGQSDAARRWDVIQQSGFLNYMHVTRSSEMFELFRADEPYLFWFCAETELGALW